VFVTIDGERRKITKREAVIHQPVNKSAGAGLRATKMLIDMMKDIENKAGAAPPPEPAPLTDPDANSPIHTCGSNNDRDTLIVGRNHGALMPRASLSCHVATSAGPRTRSAYRPDARSPT
jgi:hypothetical protein